ncbi:BTAD domain-containing putative transcriptional regulator [Glycomyces arizonensis]|uniref:BTAD domain-containing putative transcriptional regulator n=1 Tax=Glycomyces arizonensis TaxID=256035 RepID=UPI000427EAB9|nr:BTAD domain-containing putative transcriptional regulator [Glycomyces arizonensis]
MSSFRSPPPLTVGVLGPLEVVAGEGEIAIAGARLRALVTRLARAVPDPVSAAALAADLWPDESPADPAAAVRSLVTRLRRLLPPDTIASTPRGYRLAVEPEAVDALRFHRMAAEGRRALRSGDAGTARRSLTEGLGLWRGPALADAPEAVGARAALEEERLAAVEDRAEAALVLGDGAALVASLAEHAAAHPLRERLHAMLFRTMAEAGRGAEALAAYEALRERLADELGADPGAELRAVHLALLEPPAARPHRSTGNLRAPLTSFIGRETEIDQLAQALRGSRLVTLCGPGGVGKTRLATAVAAAQERPAWIAELASVTDPADVPQAVALAVGAAEPELRGRADPLPGATADRLAETFASRPALLVLDNCEHVIAAAAELAERLLLSCPGLTVLATSREPLLIGGETAVPLGPLPAEAAVRLFADRAAAVRPGFTVDASNGAAVAEICRRLDGLPLAIELAAVRLRALEAEQLAARLDDRFRLLTGGPRTAMPRHQTLRAVVAWSWDLLDPGERALAEAASVFGGGLTIESAEALGHALDTLTALADKSILRPTGTGRFHMLETLREYGRERLAEADTLGDARGAHAAYCLDLAERAAPHLRAGDQLEWMARLDAEHDNILAALHFAAAAGDADTAQRIGAAMSVHWMLRGARPEVTAWLETARDTPGEAEPVARAVVTGMAVINRMSCGTFQPDQVLADFERVVAEAGRHRDHPLLALGEPLLHMFTHDHPRSLDDIDARLDHPDPWTRAMLRVMRAMALEDRGEMTAMREDLRRAVAGFRGVGERFGLQQALAWLGQADLMFGDTAAGSAALEEAIALQRTLSPGTAAVRNRTVAAGARLMEGRVDAARAELEAIVDDAESEGEHPQAGRQVLYAHLALGDLARSEHRLDDADAHYEAAEWPIGSQSRRSSAIPPQWRVLAARARALLTIARGDTGAAASFLDEAVANALEAMDMPVVAKAAVAAAALLAAEGRDAEAAALLGAADRLRGAPDRSDLDAVRVEEALRERLGAAAFEAAAGAARAGDRESALALLDQTRRR